ncbi:carbonic anhydrase family protein [Pseudoalteromonas tunicata]|uniref:carbonic anhydrase family protein n=1 Tax=Pseudoalteromonas tunicata TaxID=314281 RepID=UPI00273D3429|nr:carbonic anhydrase family protein [Pseudoalteromonas tunicata]MDP4982831.1 carbonic anhydrase family protein [Pseudoalteromonas tunicata]
MSLNKLVLAASLGLGLSLLPITSFASVPAQTAVSQSAITPDQALKMLIDGNKRFVDGKMVERDLNKQVSATGAGQYPYATIIGCIDSRVPHELVFDAGIGDIFSARIAGNFVNTDILGSVEFATAVAGSKLIVVLGHTSCGAVKGACDNVELGNLTHTLSNIAPAIYATTDIPGVRNSKNKEFVQAVADKNVELTVQNILDRSPVIADLVKQGKVKVVGAMHDVATGQVTFTK